MMCLKSIASKILAVVLLAGCVQLGVCAERYNDEIAGIEYDSVEDLQNCIKKHSTRHSPEQPYLTTMNRLFIPETLDGNLDKINGLTLTPTYVSVGFDSDGQHLELRHYVAGGESTYKSAKDSKNSNIYDYHALSKKVDGHVVYSYYSCCSEYCWKQGNEVFLLRTFDEASPKERHNFNLCKAVSVPLYEIIQADAPAAKIMANKKEKIQFRVLDQNGKPVTNAQFVLPELQALVLTDTDGKTYYCGKAFEKQDVTIYYTDSNGNEQYVKRRVTVSDKHLKNGKMRITFKVKI